MKLTRGEELIGHCAGCGRVCGTTICRTCERGEIKVDAHWLPDRRWRGMLAYGRNDGWHEPSDAEPIRGGRGIVP